MGTNSREYLYKILIDKMIEKHGMMGGELFMTYGLNSIDKFELNISKGEVEKLMEISFIEGVRAATGLGMMECKMKIKKDPDYFKQFFDFKKFKIKNQKI